MKWREFIQLAIIYPLFLASLVYSIIVLEAQGLDTYFLITFIIAVLTIILSIYYSGKTNEVFEKIIEKISGIEKDSANTRALTEQITRVLNGNKQEDFAINEERMSILDKKIEEELAK